MDIVKAETVATRTSYVKALIYGQAGAGKTRFAADSPKPFYFDSESSTETLRHWPEYSEIPVKKPSSVDELQRDVEKAIKDPSIETVVIDSITTMLDGFMRQYVAKQVQTNSKRSDVNELWESDYKYATQVFTKLFADLQDAPINVVIIGHERVFRNDEGKVESIYPDVTPRLQQAVTRLVNVVAYMETTPSNFKGMKRKLYVNRTPIIEAKNRLNIQDIFIDDPEWKKVFS